MYVGFIYLLLCIEMNLHIEARRAYWQQATNLMSLTPRPLFRRRGESCGFPSHVHEVLIFF